MREPLPEWLVAALAAGAGLDDATLVAAAEQAGVGLVEVDDEGAVRWTDEAYRLHGRPRWRRVRSIDDVTRGLSAADAGRVTAAYLSLVGEGDVSLLYTVTAETGLPLDVLLVGRRPGLATVARAAFVALGRPEDAPASVEQQVEQQAGQQAGPEAPVVAVVAEEPEQAPAPAALPPAAAPASTTADDVKAAESAFRELFYGSPSGLAALDESGRFVRVNDAFLRLVGRTRESVLDTVYEALIHHEDRASAVVARARRDGGTSAPDEHRLVHSDGSLVWVRAHTSSITYQQQQLVLVTVENVSEAREREDRLRHDALHDPLTGLPNRRLLLDRLERALSRSRRAGARTAVFFIDLDDLKHVNDTHAWGHRAGDILLGGVAVALRGSLRDTDTLGRLGGDEFLAVCEDVDDDAVEELGQRLLEATSQPVQLGSGSVTPSVSIGVAVTEDPDETAAELLGRADAAMYRAKSRGGRRVERAGAEPSAPVDLVGALAREELRLQYQPVVSLGTGAVLGVGAVLRWVHPRTGLMPAHEVRTALDSTASLPVVDWAVRQVVEDVRMVAPSRVDHVSVWLPVPGRAVQASSTVDAVRAAIAGQDGSGTPETAPSLVLDVHESDLVHLTRRSAAMRRLDELGRIGPVALGVEHLSADVLPLGTMQLLGAASASVDPELLHEAAENEAVEALVRSLVAGATALGVVTVATGVTTQALLDEARRLGVHAVQGDLVGPPASLEVYSDLLHGGQVLLPGAEAEHALEPLPPAPAAPRSTPGLAPVVATIRHLESLPTVSDDDVPAGDAVPFDAAADDVPAGGAVPADAAAADDDVVVDVTTDEADLEPAAVEAAPASPDATAAAVEPVPVPRLLLTQVVDLAEQVARELGVELPDEAPPVEDLDPAPSAAPARTLPGIADLEEVLRSTEGRNALDRGPASPAYDPPGTDAASPAYDAPGTDAASPAYDLRDTDGASAPDEGAGPGTVDGTVDLRDAPQPGRPLRSTAPRRDVDLRSPARSTSPVRGADAPSLFLRMPAPGAGIRLDGRGGSEGSSLL